MILFFGIILGLIVGSFLNAVIHRLHTGESFLTGRSACPHCHKEIEGRDLIPVISFLLLKGKCRSCGKRISWQYPLVEILTALVFGLLVVSFPFSLPLYVSAAFAAFFILISVYDFKHFLILDKVLLPLGALAIAWNLYQGQAIEGLLSGLGLMAFFGFQYLLSQGRWIGFGDVKYGFVLGNIFLWPGSLVCLFLAYILGAVVGSGLMAAGRKSFASQLPMGTFLGVSAIITVLYGTQIAEWYLGLIGF